MPDYNVFVIAVRTMTEPAPDSEYNATGITFYVKKDGYIALDDVFYIEASDEEEAKKIATDRFLEEYDHEDDSFIDKDSIHCDAYEVKEE